MARKTISFQASIDWQAFIALFQGLRKNHPRVFGALMAYLFLSIAYLLFSIGTPMMQSIIFVIVLAASVGFSLFWTAKSKKWPFLNVAADTRINRVWVGIVAALTTAAVMAAVVIFAAKFPLTLGKWLLGMLVVIFLSAVVPKIRITLTDKTDADE